VRKVGDHWRGRPRLPRVPDRYRDRCADPRRRLHRGQIPGIDDRVFPASLAGPAYPEGIPIRPESELERLVAEHDVDEVVLAYSDLAHTDVMHQASRVFAAGADFVARRSPLDDASSRRPVVGVGAVRTGCGKSQTTRHRAAAARSRPARRPHPPPDAVRRPRADAGPALREPRRHRRQRSDDRGARGVRGAGPARDGDVRGGGLRRDPRGRRGRGRRHRVGRREQRLPVRRPRRDDHGRRPAASRTRARPTTRGGQPPAGRHRRRQQGRQRGAGRRRHRRRQRRGRRPGRDRGARGVTRHARRRGASSGSACWSSRTGRPSPTAGCRSAPAVAARAAGASELSTRGRTPSAPSARPTPPTPTSGTVLPAMGYGASSSPT
jgi:hypothetical protein